MPAKAVTPADKPVTTPNKASAAAVRSPKRRIRILRFLLFLFLTIALLGAAAAGAIHYKLVDLVKLDSQWGFSKYPVVGDLIKPLISEPLADIPVQQDDEPKIIKPNTSIPAKPPESPPEPVLPKPSFNPLSVPVDNSELAKQTAQRKEEEQRRLVRVARLYDGMKPEEAAPILNELEDEAVLLLFSKMDQERVAKIMTLFDPKRSARLSNSMLKGRVTD